LLHLAQRLFFNWNANAPSSKRTLVHKLQTNNWVRSKIFILYIIW